MRNLAFDVLKRRKVEKRAGDDGPFWAVPHAEPTPEQSALFCDQVRIVADVLSSRPIEVRIAVEMHRFGGFTLEEVASHLGISVATAHRHVRSAIEPPRDCRRHFGLSHAAMGWASSIA